MNMRIKLLTVAAAAAACFGTAVASDAQALTIPVIRPPIGPIRPPGGWWSGGTAQEAMDKIVQAAQEACKASIINSGLSSVEPEVLEAASAKLFDRI